MNVEKFGSIQFCKFDQSALIFVRLLALSFLVPMKLIDMSNWNWILLRDSAHLFSLNDQGDVNNTMNSMTFV